jgi:integrative and conjugative element protein (TIGR02256 family)
VLIFERPNGGMLRISDSVLAVVETHRQRSCWATEAGGVLLGRLIIERPDIVVDAVTVPTKKDARSRFAFHRAARPTQNAVDRAWAASDGERNYLGEWHTHPEDIPHPSSIDRRGWVRLARTAQFEQDSLVFLIIGRVTIAAWEVCRNSSLITQLHVVEAPSGPKGW